MTVFPKKLAEKNILTPEAGVDSPGVLRWYDSSAFLPVIREASSNADYVIASVHFGTEYSNQADASLLGVKFIPCIQENYRTTWPRDMETQRRI